MMRMLSKNCAQYLVNVARCVISAGTALFAMQHTPDSTIIVAIPTSVGPASADVNDAAMATRAQARKFQQCATTN